MASEYLTQNEKSRLLDILFDASLTFDGVEKKFKELVPAARFVVASHEVKNIVRDLIFASDGPALVTALFIADVMRRAECMPAKSLLFDTLVELEKAIRKDMFLQEQVKYASKDAKEGKKGVDAIQADELRVHCAAKLFIFDSLGGSVSGDTKASSRLAASQEELDGALDAWEKSSIKIREPLADITHCWTSDAEKQRCKAPLESGAVFDKQAHKRTAIVMQTAGARVPSVPVSGGELRFLFPNEQSFLLFDGEAPSQGWVAARQLVESAATAAMSREDQQKLSEALSDSVLKRLHFDGKLIDRIAEHNPEACAVIMSKLPVTVTSPLIQGLIASKVSRTNVQTVLLHAPQAMEQINMRAFIVNSTKEFKEKPNDTDGLKAFILCLHQLVTKARKENKELYIADAVRPELEQLVQASGAADIISRWEEMKN